MKEQSSLILKIEKNERVYEFIIPGGAPYGEVFDALYECLKHMHQVMEKSVKDTKPPSAEEGN